MKKRPVLFISDNPIPKPTKEHEILKFNWKKKTNLEIHIIHWTQLQRQKYKDCATYKHEYTLKR